MTPPVSVAWRGEFENSEVNALHAQAFGHRVYEAGQWDWRSLVERHSLGWVTARRHRRLVGFVNVVWDGLVHAWIQDVMVDEGARRGRIGTRMVAAAARETGAVGCEWLHVDFDEEHRDFYIDACGFTPTQGGLIALIPPDPA